MVASRPKTEDEKSVVNRREESLVDGDTPKDQGQMEDLNPKPSDDPKGMSP